jgi:hypothetical protein
MLFREIISVYCENNVKRINTMCGQNSQSFNLKAKSVKHTTYKATLEHILYSSINRINYGVQIQQTLDNSCLALVNTKLLNIRAVLHSAQPLQYENAGTVHIPGQKGKET